MILGNWTTFRAVFADGGAPVDITGVLEWEPALMRALSFDGGITGTPTPITAFPFTVTVDGGAAGAMAYDAYLSQRTDDVAAQYLRLTTAAGKSGSWTIRLTAEGASELGLASVTDAVTIDQLRVALKHVTLYVRRQSDGSIQLLHLLDATLGGLS